MHHSNDLHMLLKIRKQNNVCYILNNESVNNLDSRQPRERNKISFKFACHCVSLVGSRFKIQHFHVKLLSLLFTCLQKLFSILIYLALLFHTPTGFLFQLRFI